MQLSDWIKEKYQTATDESYRDLTNLLPKLQKHQAFEAELKANNDRLGEINKVISVTQCWRALNPPGTHRPTFTLRQQITNR